MSLGTHRAVFRWVLKRLVLEGLLKGKTLGADAITLEENAVLNSIARLDIAARDAERVRALMEAEDTEEATSVQRQRFDRKCKKSLANREWVNPQDEESRMARKQDDRIRLACKPEHAVDPETGALVALTVQFGVRRDTASMRAMLAEAGQTVVRVKEEAKDWGVVADKGYHSRQTVRDLTQMSVATMIAEPERKRWIWESAARMTVYVHQWWLEPKTGKARTGKHGELIERRSAQMYDTGGMGRVHLRGKATSPDARSSLRRRLI